MASKENKLEIYCGQVGKSYVDLETAQRELDHAKQNKEDWTALKEETINLCEEAKRLKGDVQSIYDKINNLCEQIESSDCSKEAKAEAKRMLADLLHIEDANSINAEDVKKTNDENLEKIDEIIKRLNCDDESDKDALKCLTHYAQAQVSIWEEASKEDGEYAQVVEAAQTVFESYLENYEPESEASKSDKLEANFKAELASLELKLNGYDIFGPETNEVLNEVQNVLNA